MRRQSPRRSLTSFPARRRSSRRGGFRPLVSRLEDRMLLSLSPTFTSVVASPDKVGDGVPVTFTATVSELPPAGATPTGGTVTFYDGATALGTAPLSGGASTLTTTALPVGEQTISAVYSGDGQDFAGSSSGTIQTVAGDGSGAGSDTGSQSGDGGPATAAELGSIGHIALDTWGDLFILDGKAVREVLPSGIITTVVGDISAGYSADNGPASNPGEYGPGGLAVDAQGDLFISDGNDSVVREVKATDSNGVPSISPSSPIITVADNGTAGDSGDGGPATDAQLRPGGVAVDARGDLFIADSYNNVVREVTPGPDGSLADGTITTVAGNGYDAGVLAWYVPHLPPGDIVYPGPGATLIPAGGYSGDGGPATAAELAYPTSVAVDAQGDLFIEDASNNAIREVSPAGIITTAAQLNVNDLFGIGGGRWGDFAVNARGDVFLANPSYNTVTEVLPDGTQTVVAGRPNDQSGYSGDGGPATAAAMSSPFGIAVDARGDLFIADVGNYVVRQVGLGAAVNVAPPPLVTITASTDSSVFAGVVTFTAAVTAQAPGFGAPAGGTVTFYDGATGSGPPRSTKASPPSTSTRWPSGSMRSRRSTAATAPTSAPAPASCRPPLTSPGPARRP